MIDLLEELKNIPRSHILFKTNSIIDPDNNIDHFFNFYTGKGFSLSHPRNLQLLLRTIIPEIAKNPESTLSMRKISNRDVYHLRGRTQDEKYDACYYHIFFTRIIINQESVIKVALLRTSHYF